MRGILKEIIEYKQFEVEQRKKAIPIEKLMEQLVAMPPARDFNTALKRKTGPVKLLAEIKAASPSRGIIREEFDPGNIAKAYQDCGASAISVLTDQKFFSGSDEHLKTAKAGTTVPILRKDFTVDIYQLYESKIMGADAVLLMSQVLEPEIFAFLLQKATELELYTLAEGHTAEQIQFLVDVGATHIGINNRDFETMKVDIRTTLDNRHRIPAGRVIVSQSGIFHREEVLLLEQEGVDAIQVGTSIMLQDDVREQIQALLGIRE